MCRRTAGIPTTGSRPIRRTPYSASLCKPIPKVVPPLHDWAQPRSWPLRSSPSPPAASKPWPRLRIEITSKARTVSSPCRDVADRPPRHQLGLLMSRPGSALATAIARRASLVDGKGAPGQSGVLLFFEQPMRQSQPLFRAIDTRVKISHPIITASASRSAIQSSLNRIAASQGSRQELADGGVGSPAGTRLRHQALRASFRSAGKRRRRKLGASAPKVSIVIRADRSGPVHTLGD